MATGQRRGLAGLREVFCTNCGHQNHSYANFCSSCGSVFTNLGGDTTVTLHPIDSQGARGDKEFTFTLPERPSQAGWLLVNRGPTAGARYILEAEVSRVGRHPDSDIFLDDVTVSRRHAEFSRQGAGYSVRDVGSLNGTYVNRSRVTEAMLSSGDEVQIGKFRLVYVALAAEA